MFGMLLIKLVLGLDSEFFGGFFFFCPFNSMQCYFNSCSSSALVIWGPEIFYITEYLTKAPVILSLTSLHI